MANKTLTATVKINTKNAEASLKRLQKLINNINRATNKSNAKNLTKNFTKTNQVVNKINNSLQRTNQQTSKVANTTNKAAGFAQKWHNAQNKTVNSIKSAANGLKGCLSRLKAIAATYLGIMGMRTMINTSDIITSAKNRLNYVNSQQLGATGTNSDGSYSDATFSATSSDLDKMYASAQKVRMGYTNMINNVSKSMVLAGDAFGNNTDAAIRFQEVMAEAYTVGGASAEEMSTSMYQLIQALGAGTLAGDELRSVREGAPLAYKAIEEFVQGIYNTDESLKDLAADGKVSSDMVVAAMLNAEGAAKQLDEAFAQTDQTFAQTWQQIKNSATKAFEPVSTMLNKMLNDAIDNGLVEKIESFFTEVSKILQIIVQVIRNVFGWIVDNWYWLEGIIIPAIIALGVLIVGTAVASFIAWALANLPLIVIFISIFAIIWALYAWQSGMISTTDMIVTCALAIILVILLIAALTGSIPILVIAAVLLVLTVIFYFLEQVLGGITWFGILCKNIGLEIAGFFKALAWVIANAFMTAVEFVVDLFNGSVSWIGALFTNLGQTIKGIATNIGIAFSNAWNGALSDFWNFIASCLEGLDWLAKPMEAIAELFGKSFDYSSFTQGIRDKASVYESKQKEYVEWNGFEEGWSANAWKSGTDKWTAPKWAEDSSWSEMQNSVGGFEEGWSQEAYAIGAGWGSDFKNWINTVGDDGAKSVNDKLSNLGKGLMDGSLLDNIGKGLGLDFNPEDPTKNPTKEYSVPTAEELLSGIKDDTSNMSDDLDLADDDLEFLRKIAEMEWRNEFTTAEIKVEMTNHNNIQSERDWEDILTYFSDRIREEATSVADGVHVR